MFGFLQRRTGVTAALLLAACLCIAEAAAAEPTSSQPVASRSDPAAPTPEQIQAWIKQLGDDDFQTRESAQKALVKAGNPAYFALEVLPPSKDPEVKVRVKRTLTALEEDAVERLRKAGASLSNYQSENWIYFTLKNPDARDDDLAPLVRLKHLETIRLEDASFTDNALDHCRHLTKLYSFSSYHTEMTDAGLAKLRQFPNLAGVNLSLPRMTNKGMETIATLPKLRQFSIVDTPIDGEGLKHLRPLKDQIDFLGLEGTLVSDDDLVLLRDFAVLQSLRLNRTKVTGAGLRHIRDLPKLKSLVVGGTKLADEAFVHLAKMPALERVYFRDASVSSENLLLLRESTSLVSIDISADELTEKEVDAIQKTFNAREIAHKTKIHRTP